ncbi:DUF2188 domain-containing protein [Amycolatopsis sp. lyj-90]|uniref:DUF2188 domain-containing protein n=1 Tax=Amycolatopsis sp. lyj-90 TaxID=2789285 RepID=UPI00397BFF92
MAAKDVHVVPTATGGWRVVTPAQQSERSRVFKTQHEAVNYALATQRNRRISDVTYSAKTGAFRAEVKKGRRTTVRAKGASKRKPTVAGVSPRLENLRQMQAEHDATGAPGSSFLEAIKTAAMVNEAALNRLAK